MAVTFEDRLTRAGKKLDTINTRITELETQRTAVLSEIAEITGSGGASSRTTFTSTPTTKQKGALWDRISARLTPDGMDVNSIATALKVKPNQVALSLFHATRAKKVTMQNDKYYPVEVTAAAKTLESLD